LRLTLPRSALTRSISRCVIDLNTCNSLSNGCIHTALRRLRWSACCTTRYWRPSNNARKPRALTPSYPRPATPRPSASGERHHRCQRPLHSAGLLRARQHLSPATWNTRHCPRSSSPYSLDRASSCSHDPNLPQVVAYLRSFPAFHEVVISCARKHVRSFPPLLRASTNTARATT
jgi:hypothetical protein